MSLVGRYTPCLVLAAAVTLTLAACGSPAASSSGGSATKISVGSVGPESGAESAIFVANEAMKAYFENMNASGGINGQKVSVYVDDDQFNAANTQGAVRGLVAQDKVQMTCAIAGTPDNAAVRVSGAIQHAGQRRASVRSRAVLQPPPRSTVTSVNATQSVALRTYLAWGPRLPPPGPANDLPPPQRQGRLERVPDPSRTVSLGSGTVTAARGADLLTLGDGSARG